MYIHTENPCCIIAYNNIFTKQEIGRLELIINPTADYFRIDGFRVHQKWRNKGVGRKLIQQAKKIVKVNGGKRFLVYPNSEPYKGEDYVEPEVLYKIYQHLGFQLEDLSADIKKPDHLMVMFL